MSNSEMSALRIGLLSQNRQQERILASVLSSRCVGFTRYSRYTEAMEQPRGWDALIVDLSPEIVRSAGNPPFRQLEQLMLAPDGPAILGLYDRATPERVRSRWKDLGRELLHKPVTGIELRELCAENLQYQSGLISSIGSANSKLIGPPLAENVGSIVGVSKPLERVIHTALRVAQGPAETVLLTGESGTGKELFARLIHEASPASEGPYRVVNCSAIPESLLDSELYGHVTGSFTGAEGDRSGVFLAAEGGTIVLDEIGDFPLAGQAKLLRFLENRSLRPVGADKERRINLRVIASTNRDLLWLVEEGRFRLDLLHRLNALEIQLPPLRDRREDVPFLVAHFLQELSHLHHRLEPDISHTAMDLLSERDYPGNVRELRNTLERALIATQSDTIGSEHIPQWQPSRAILDPGEAEKKSEVEPTVESLRDMERKMIERALTQAHFNKSQAARLLSISRQSLDRKLKHHGITITRNARREVPSSDAN